MKSLEKRMLNRSPYTSSSDIANTPPIPLLSFSKARLFHLSICAEPGQCAVRRLKSQKLMMTWMEKSVKKPMQNAELERNYCRFCVC